MMSYLNLRSLYEHSKIFLYIWQIFLAFILGEKYVEVSGPIIPLQKADDEKCTTLMSADAKVVLENK